MESKERTIKNQHRPNAAARAGGDGDKAAR